MPTKPGLAADGAAQTHAWVCSLLWQSRWLHRHIAGLSGVGPPETAWVNMMATVCEVWLQAAATPPAHQGGLPESEAAQMAEQLPRARATVADVLGYFFPVDEYRLDLAVAGLTQITRRGCCPRFVTSFPTDDRDFWRRLEPEPWVAFGEAIGCLYGIVLSLRRRFPELDRIQEDPETAISWRNHCQGWRNVELWGNAMLYGLGHDAQADLTPNMPASFYEQAQRIEQKYSSPPITVTFLKKTIDLYLNQQVKTMREMMADREFPPGPGEMVTVSKTTAVMMALFCEEARPLDFPDPPEFPVGQGITADVATRYMEGLRACCIRRMAEEPTTPSRAPSFSGAEPVMVGSAEMAKLLNIHPKSAPEWAGRLGGTKVDGEWQTPRGAVLEAMAKRALQGKPDPKAGTVAADGRDATDSNLGFKRWKCEAGHTFVSASRPKKCKGRGGTCRLTTFTQVH